MVAVFVFAAQMVNFPVGAGTSGHLIGAALAAVLVGPATATLCLTVVLAAQAFLFADGGAVLWAPTSPMGVVAVWVGCRVFRVALALLPRRLSSVSIAPGIGALRPSDGGAGLRRPLRPGGAAPVPLAGWLR